jgi:hypothetical protein
LISDRSRRASERRDDVGFLTEGYNFEKSRKPAIAMASWRNSFDAFLLRQRDCQVSPERICWCCWRGDWIM